MELGSLLNIYKIIIQYKGTQYQGFQVQKNGRTIQGELNNVLKTLSHSEEIKTIGSGRTDSGVHAIGQVVKIEIPVSIPAENLKKALNSLLPADIRVTHVEESNVEFHPIFSAKSKEYNYLFSTKSIMSPFASELVTSVDFDLDISLMNEGCKLLLGSHDFINYQCVGTDVDSTIRNIYECEILHMQSNDHLTHVIDDYYVLRIVGNGFLKQMVRLIMGALWALGRGKITLQDLKDSLTRPLDSRLGATAPPQGLYLKVVHY